MPDRCVVYGCSNTYDKDLGISIHKLPFFGNDKPEAKKRRKKWTDFVRRKRAKWSDSRHSVVCSEHFVSEDFDRQFASVPGMEISYRRNLISDEIGVKAFPSIQEPKMRSKARTTTARSRRRIVIYRRIFVNVTCNIGNIQQPVLST